MLDLCLFWEEGRLRIVRQNVRLASSSELGGGHLGGIVRQKVSLAQFMSCLGQGLEAPNKVERGGHL